MAMMTDCRHSVISDGPDPQDGVHELRNKNVLVDRDHGMEFEDSPIVNSKSCHLQDENWGQSCKRMYSFLSMP